MDFLERSTIDSLIIYRDWEFSAWNSGLEGIRKSLRKIIYFLQLAYLFAAIFPVDAKAKGLSSFDEFAEYLSQNPSTTIEKFQWKLDPEIRSRYQFVYESRSPNPSTLLRPRIILSNKDASLIIGIPSSAELKRGNIIEVIEADEKTNILSFRELAFGSGKVEINRSPKSCINCHGNPHSEYPNTVMRPLWDGYPDWPGVIGMSHNDLMYQRSKFGTSTVRDLEYEKLALENLQKTQLPRVKSLIHLESATLSSLSTANSMFTEALIRRNLINLLGAVEARALKIFLSDNQEYRKIRSVLNEFLTSGKVRETDASVLANLRSRMQHGHAREKIKKTERLLRLVETYGTQNDKSMLLESSENFMRHRLVVETGYAFNIYPLHLIGIDPSTYSIVRELFVTGPGSPTVGDLDLVWKRGLLNIFKSDTHPTLGSNACRVLLSPSANINNEETIQNWIDWLDLDQ